jgi:hypothetical protein
MQRYRTFVLVLILSLAAGPAVGQSLVLYDDFADGRILPEKWMPSPICSGNGYDCAREVRNEHLRLAVRNYGRNIEGGVTFDASQVLFLNPDAIDTIRLRLRVDSFGSAACPGNPEAAHPQLLLAGNFFNTGTGASQDDVAAFLMVERRTDDLTIPATSLRVGGFMAINSISFNNVDLGTLEVGEAATATLHWNRQNHTFVVRIVKTVTTPAVVEATMPYAQSDTTPAAQPYKALQVNAFTPNCTTTRALSAMEARVDAVRVNASAVR